MTEITCKVPPSGWYCTRPAGHAGPCAAWPEDHRPKKIARTVFDAVGELALAIKPHHMDTDQRQRIAAALHVLVDHIIAIGDERQP
jgi:ABC-type antimicrobial peptide transport system ATPase subunit